MSWSIHHVNLEAKNVRKSAAFYTAILGMDEGEWQFPPSRGYIPSSPDRLALFPDARSGHNGLHLIKADPDFANANGLTHNPSIGGHVAFEVSDLKAVIARLKEAGIRFSDAGVFAIPGLWNIYLEDPDGNLIEINQRV